MQNTMPFGGQNQNNIVGFTAIHNTENHVEYTLGDKIVYGQVSSNYGNCYDGGTGVFTCCTSGYYFFSFSGLQSESTHVEASLRVNGVTMATIFAMDDSGNSATAGVVALCQQGQEVWVETERSYMWVHNGPYHTFSGVLIQVATN